MIRRISMDMFKAVCGLLGFVLVLMAGIPITIALLLIGLLCFFMWSLFYSEED